ncbi:hypothetical protein PFISCL1PPCAC_14965, partial [Pristionchus fissidentatus]
LSFSLFATIFFPMRRLLLSFLLITVSAVKDYGIPGWKCDPQVMKKSASIPQSVHSLRYADIKIVAAIGDSITAGNGAGATSENDTLALSVQYRGLTFSAGGDLDLDQHVTLANILKKFNPDIFGFSIKTGSANVWANAQLNAAIPGARAVNLTSQAIDLVQRFKDHPDKVDIVNDWKLVHIFIGGNDICAWCAHPEDESADLFGQRIGDAIQILKDNLPRTIVVITGMLDITVLREMDAKSSRCDVMHRTECACEQNQKHSTDELRGVCKEYMQKEDDLQASGRFDTDDHFTIVIQPFFEDYDHAPLLPDGSADISLFAPDCFHFSQFGHALVGRNLWNNLLQPVGSKSMVADLTNLDAPLNCPDTSCPFIRTTKNSVNCTQFMTPSM